MEFSRQEYWRGLPFPSPGDSPDVGIKPGSPALQEDSLLSEPPGKPSELEDTLKILSRKPLIFPWKTLKIRGEVTYPNQLGPPPWGFSSRLLSYFLQQFCGPVDYNTAHGQKILPHQQNSFPGWHRTCPVRRRLSFSSSSAPALLAQMSHFFLCLFPLLVRRR